MEQRKVEFITSNLPDSILQNVLYNLRILKNQIIPQIPNLNLKVYSKAHKDEFCAIGYCGEKHQYFDLDAIDPACFEGEGDDEDEESYPGDEILRHQETGEYSEAFYEFIEQELFSSSQIHIKLVGLKETRTLTWYLFRPSMIVKLDEYVILNGDYASQPAESLTKQFNTSLDLYMVRLDRAIRAIENTLEA